MTIFGKDKCLDFTYIDDAVDGVMLAIEQFDDVKNDTFNLAYGEGGTIVRLAEMIKELTGSDSEIKMGEVRTGEVIKYVADITKAKKILGFDPKTRARYGTDREGRRGGPRKPRAEIDSRRPSQCSG